MVGQAREVVGLVRGLARVVGQARGLARGFEQGAGNCHQPETRAVGHPCNPSLITDIIIATLAVALTCVTACDACF